MRRRLAAVVLMTAGLGLACSDSTGPTIDRESGQPAISTAVRPLQWGGIDGPPRFTAVGAFFPGAVPSVFSPEIFASPTIPPPALAEYETNFWAVAGQDRNVRIDYLDETETFPFAHLKVSPGALHRWPDGTPFADGDSVLITMTVDTAAMAIYFEPAGLQFRRNEPAQLKMWYSAARGDLDGDGEVDEEDERIERHELGLFYQEVPNEEWEPYRAKHSRAEDWFKAKVFHFSGFAIAY